MGGAFFEEGVGAFGHVGGIAQGAEESCIAGEGLVERQIETLIDGTERGGNGERRLGGNFAGEGFSAGDEFGGGDHLIDKADAEGFLRVDNGASEEELERGAAADETRKTLRATVSGDETELDFWLTEFGVVGCDAEGAGHGEFATAAEREALDAGDDGLAQGLNAAENGLAAERKGFA